MQSLAERLRSETRTLHLTAERSRFMGELLHGRLARSAYCALLRNLHAIYAALEPALQRHALHPAIAPIYSPALWRTQALAMDLIALHGESWHAAWQLQPATQRYVSRLNQLVTEQPELLLAHAYVRYLGDLSGGQLLRRIVANTLGAPEGEGTAFYHFGDATETRALTQSFRAGLAQIAVDANGADSMVGEAVQSFELHCELFDQLAHSNGLS